MSDTSRGDTVMNRRNAFRDLALREIDLLNERTNILLVYNSILLAGLALGGPSEPLRLAITVSGLVATAIWLYLGQRGIVLEQFAWQKVLESEAQLESDQRIHTEFINERDRTRPRIFGRRSSIYVGRVLPAMWTITWVAVFAATVTQ